MDWKLVLQIAGVVLGLLYLWLEYRADIRLWVVGLIMPLVHGALYYKAGLYADCSMQAYYVLAGLDGWIVWHNAPRRNAAADRSGHTPLRQAAGLIAAPRRSAYGHLLPARGIHQQHRAVLGRDDHGRKHQAMWMLSRKYVEQWLVWLAVDLVTVGLYLYKGIPLTAGLYALYSALAVAGYLRWKQNARIATGLKTTEGRPLLRGRPSISSIRAAVPDAYVTSGR
ncbi:MAG: nicotinamide mononucleotide transporter family protein [Alistipes onderdonkii]